MEGRAGSQMRTKTTLLVSEENLYQCEFEYQMGVKAQAMTTF